MENLCKCGCCLELNNQDKKYQTTYIHGHNGKGKKRTKETRMKISQALKGKIVSMETRKKQSQINIGRRLSEETKKRISKNNAKYWEGRFRSEETKRKISETKKGNCGGSKHPLYGKKFTDESKQKMRNAHNKIWRNPELKELRIKKYLNSLMKRPTSFEQQIMHLCKKHNLPFKYVGNGEAIIGYKNPDFIEINGKKLLIEVYHDYFKKSDYEENRSKIFSNYGYKTLFLNDRDMLGKGWEKICLDKIKLFME